MPRVSDKRERLIAAGQRLFHRRGVADTSLADVAENLGVPMGNIYYYFKTKDELVEAVAEHQRHGIYRLFEELDRNPQPEQRLSKFLASFESVREERAAYGCPVGVLCQEMTRGSDPSTAEARAGFRTNRFVAGAPIRGAWIFEKAQPRSCDPHPCGHTGRECGRARLSRRQCRPVRNAGDAALARGRARQPVNACSRRGKDA